MGFSDKARQAAATIAPTPVRPAPATTLAALSTLPALTEPLRLPLGVAPMPHQEVPVQAVRDGHRSLLIGDEMGVGKTLTAIAVVEDQAAYPALFVVPPALVRNWEREIGNAVPHRSVATISGTKAGVVPNADIVIVPDSVVANWALVRQPDGKKTPTGPLVRPWAALVMDECHRAKNEKAGRTRGVLAVSQNLAPDAVRLLLSGTPLLNKPIELAAPLAILGHLGPLFRGAWQYKQRYCGATQKSIGRGRLVWDFQGQAHLDELHDILRSHVMVRRKRDDVLTLPNKGRSLVRVALSSQAQRDYDHAQRNLVDYLRRVRDDDEYDVNWRAEALVLLTTLRQVSGKGKVEAVVEAALDLLDEGEQVFIAAWHQDVVDALWSALSVKTRVVTITGSTSKDAKQAAVDAFQSGHARVVIGNIQAAGVGFTLTAGRHILVAELPWTPGELQQVEDRLHRIGQTRDVISQVFLSDVEGGSVDERLWDLLDDKATIVGAVLDGDYSGIAIDSDSTRDRLLASY